MIENGLQSLRRRGPKTALNNLIESFGFVAIHLAGGRIQQGAVGSVSTCRYGLRLCHRYIEGRCRRCCSSECASARSSFGHPNRWRGVEMDFFT